MQVYGLNRKETDVEKRWVAHGVEQLMLRHPALRVAYLERDGEDPGREWSVLIRMDAAEPEGRQRKELYRWAVLHCQANALAKLHGPVYGADTEWVTLPVTAAIKPATAELVLSRVAISAAVLHISIHDATPKACVWQRCTEPNSGF